MKRLKGLSRDANPIDQPVGSYRYAKNMVLDMAKNAIVSESGDITVSELGQNANASIIGFCVLDSTEIVIFLVTSFGDSQIGVVNTDTGNHSVIFNDSACTEKLNFNLNHPIEAEYKINATDNTSVYFTDDFNPPRFINLNEPPIATPSLNIEVAFNLFPIIEKYPKATLVEVTNGGTLNVGTYWMTCQLVSRDGATTNVLDVTRPIYIGPNPEPLAHQPFGIGEAYDNVDFQGADAGQTSGKKIIVNFDNLDDSYTSIRPIVIAQVAGVRSAITLPDRPLSPGQTDITIPYTGYESSATFNLAEIQVGRASYEKAKTIAQVDDVLYLGNLVRTKVDLGYQKHANNIKIRSKQLDPNGGANDVIANNVNAAFGINPPLHAGSGTLSIFHNNINRSTPNNIAFGRSAYDNYYFKGYQRDETYAFYITWILKDGTESVAYHIPGREAVTPTLSVEGGYKETEDYITGGLGNPGPADLDTMMGPVGPVAASGITPKLFHLTTSGFDKTGGFNMGFWQNENETYPTAAEDVNGDFVGLHGQKVRHHHFPAESQIDNSNQQINGVNGSQISAHAGANFNSRGGGMIWDGGYSGQGTNCRFNPLGFYATDIAYPQELIDAGVLGYKIYYAKRDSSNATVIDSGLVHNIHGAGSVISNADVAHTWVLGQYEEFNDPVFPRRKFAFDGYHSLITGDSLESVNMFKQTRYCWLGIATGDPAASTGIDFWFTGVSSIGTDSNGDDVRGNRSNRWFVDWTRQRPSTAGSRSPIGAHWGHQSGGSQFGNPLGNGNWGSQASSGADIFPYMPIEKISYLRAGAADTTLFSGITLDNTEGTQTIAFKLSDGFRMQGYFATNGGDINAQGWGQMWFALFNMGLSQTGVANILTFQTLQSGDFDEPYHNSPGGTTSSGPGQSVSSGVLMPTTSSAQINSSQAGIFGNLYSVRSDIYTSYKDQNSLVYTGHFVPTHTINTPTVIHSTFGQTQHTFTPANDADLGVPPEVIMGGDTFLGTVAITKLKRVRPEQAPQSNVSDHGPSRSTQAFYTGTPGSGDFYDDSCTHLFPTESRSHPGLRQQQNDNERSQFFPKTERNNPAIIANDYYQREYDFNDDFNAKNTVRIVIPFNNADTSQAIDDYPTRIIRSIRFNQSGITDNFRVFLPSQYRDLPRHRGELWRLEAMKSLLIPHMEKALMITRGKEELAVGAAAAALGSGDLFERDPTEVLTTERGEGGTQSQFAGIVTRHGYFFVDVESRKVFMFGETLEEISDYGMSDWFRENLKHPLAEHAERYNLDIPTAGSGATAGYDPVLDRILLTFRSVGVTETFKANIFNNSYSGATPGDGDIIWDTDNQQFALRVLAYQTFVDNLIPWSDDTYFTYQSWTISYYPALKAWGSFHDYAPLFYPYTSTSLFKLTTNNADHVSRVYTSDPSATPGKFLNDTATNNIEFEYIDNIESSTNKLYSSINWTVDVSNPGTNVLNQTNSGFTHTFVYNTHQMSQEVALVEQNTGNQNTTSNCRRLERGWYFNNFRDDSLLAPSNSGGITASDSISMFTETGMNIIQNTAYLNPNKAFHERKKFVDKYLGVRLLDKTSISNRKVISLYLSDTSKRKFYR